MIAKQTLDQVFGLKRLNCRKVHLGNLTPNPNRL